MPIRITQKCVFIKLPARLIVRSLPGHADSVISALNLNGFFNASSTAFFAGFPAVFW